MFDWVLITPMNAARYWKSIQKQLIVCVLHVQNRCSKNFCNFHRKNTCWNLLLIKSPAQVFFCEICINFNITILKNIYERVLLSIEKNGCRMGSFRVGKTRRMLVSCTYLAPKQHWGERNDMYLKSFRITALISSVIAEFLNTLCKHF